MTQLVGAWFEHGLSKFQHLVDGQVAPLKWGDAQALEQLVALGASVDSVDHDQTDQLS
jgi:hypothetical protein